MSASKTTDRYSPIDAQMDKLAKVRDWCSIPEETAAGISGVLDAVEDAVRDLRKTDPANATMIAAAPEMLEACKAAVDAIENMIPESVGNDDADDVLGVLRAAIAKAEGGAA